MVTIFHILPLAAAIIGAGLGHRIGAQYFGNTVGGVMAVVGGILGFFLGRIPWILAWRSLNIEGKTNEQLRAILDGDQYFIYHLALAVLMKRGEDISQYKPKLVALLGSDQNDKRMFGWRTLTFAFPEVAERIPDFNPNDSPQKCREKIKIIEVSNNWVDLTDDPLRGSPEDHP